MADAPEQDAELHLAIYRPAEQCQMMLAAEVGNPFALRIMACIGVAFQEIGEGAADCLCCNRKIVSRRNLIHAIAVDKTALHARRATICEACGELSNGALLAIASRTLVDVLTHEFADRRGSIFHPTPGHA